MCALEPMVPGPEPRRTIIPLRTGWEFKEAGRRSRWRAAVVPGGVHRDLRRHGLIPDPFRGDNERALQWIEERDWIYRCRFKLTRADFAADHVELVAEGLDTLASVTVNGALVARTENMFIGHRWSIRPRLRPGMNELVIRFAGVRKYLRRRRPGHHPRDLSDPVGGCTKIRKEQCQFGWDWGPRFVTCGIWRDIALETWSRNRLNHVHVAQRWHDDGTVTLDFSPELARAEAGVSYRGEMSLDGNRVASFTGLCVRVASPERWWPNGQGAQPLYTVTLFAAHADGTPLGQWTRRIGLRTIALERRPDRWGESFRFVVNGRPIFAKGANWIPAHAFVGGLSNDLGVRDLAAAQAAYMNMIRVWGGGVYESEAFYDRCDKLGLLVWQDFMFACTPYPGDAAFRDSVRVEAEQQVRRLQHRACLALWCGNNEIAQLNEAALAQPVPRAAYRRVFHEILPRAVARYDGTTAYWPSSPWRSDRSNAPEAGERSGDTHYWDVWHARRPARDYEKWRFRFVSEFGMQSYSSRETQDTFCPPGENNLLGPLMENHQKNRNGNPLILEYVSARYPYPRNQDALLYLSQINQAYCVQTGVEHYRRNQPRCMGTLYWQLNDCWPGASWSSIEFTGRWKALHFAARRFYAPALITARLDGEEGTTLGNYRTTTVTRAELYTVFDAPQSARAEVRWDLFHVDGRRLSGGRKSVVLQPGRSVRQRTVALAGLMRRFGREQLYLRIALELAGRRVSEETVFLTPPRFMDLPQRPVRITVRALTPTSARLTFRSPGFHHRLGFELPGLPHTATDNYFELYPGEPRTVEVTFEKPVAPARISRGLQWISLAGATA